MGRIDARIAKLEAGQPGHLSEAARAWLGLRPPLSDAERAAHDTEMARLGPPDTSGWSREARVWLGRNEVVVGQ